VNNHRCAQNATLKIHINKPEIEHFIPQKYAINTNKRNYCTMSRNQQGKFWLLTIPHAGFTPYLPDGCCYIKGQLEKGEETEYLHWQILVCFTKKVRLQAVRTTFGDVHSELSRSAAANDYVWKEETRVAGTQFELGNLPLKRNSKEDWDLIKENAKKGKFDDIPSQVFVGHYRTLKMIHKDYMAKPPDLTTVCGIWYTGVPGSGKSHMARERYPNYYLKPCNKWWDNYQAEDNVIIDDLDLNHKVLGHHLKIWADKYAFLAESKGSALYARPKQIIVTSNYKISDIWFEDPVLCEALKRRFIVTEFNFVYNRNNEIIEIE